MNPEKIAETHYRKTRRDDTDVEEDAVLLDRAALGAISEGDL